MAEGENEAAGEAAEEAAGRAVGEAAATTAVAAAVAVRAPKPMGWRAPCAWTMAGGARASATSVWNWLPPAPPAPSATRAPPPPPSASPSSIPGTGSAGGAVVSCCTERGRPHLPQGVHSEADASSGLHALSVSAQPASRAARLAPTRLHSSYLSAACGSSSSWLRVHPPKSAHTPSRETASMAPLLVAKAQPVADHVARGSISATIDVVRKGGSEYGTPCAPLFS